MNDEPDAPSPADSIGSRLEFETLISDTSASLFAVAPDQVGIERDLERVRRFFHAWRPRNGV